MKERPSRGTVSVVSDQPTYLGAGAELPYDPAEDRIQFHLCGGWFRFVGGTHLSRTHGWTIAEHRDAFQIPATTATCSPSLSNEHWERTAKRIAAGDLPATGRFADSNAGAEARAKRAVARWRSLAARYPQLVAELHPTRNANLNPRRIASGSNRHVWWCCGHGHEWQARVADRSGGTGCPMCANAQRGRLLGAVNRTATPDRTLAVRQPALFAELHPSRNQDVDLKRVGVGSRRKLWWRCSQGHEWRARVDNRSRSQGTGCPVCARERPGAGRAQAAAPARRPYRPIDRCRSNTPS
jgi:hypothetical protein